MKSSPWVKWFSADFLNGISDLEPNEIAVYSVVLNLIYDNEGPIADDAVKIGRRCNMRQTSAEKALASLATAGKITRTNGQISNHRCEKEIKSRQKVSEKSSEIAHTRWKKEAEKPKEINEAPMPAHPPSNATAMLSLSLKPETEKKEEGATPPKGGREAELADAVEIYNTIAGKVGWAKVQRLTDGRQAKLRKRLGECGGVAGWAEALERAAKSRLLNGQKGDWQADFDFFMQPSRFTKLMEGGYDDRSAPRRANGPDASRSGPDQSLAAGLRFMARLDAAGRETARRDETDDILPPSTDCRGQQTSGNHVRSPTYGDGEGGNVYPLGLSGTGRYG